MIKKKLRKTLTVLGICIGTFSVVITGAVSDIGKVAINRELDSVGVNGISVTNKNETDKTLSKEVLAVLKSSKDVLNVTPLTFSITEVKARGEKEKIVIMGVDYNANEVFSLKTLHGSLIDREDVKKESQVCVVDEAFALKNYNRSNVVGREIDVILNGAPVTFEIKGVAKTGGSIVQGVMGNYIPSIIYLPYTTKQTLTMNDKFDQIAVRLKQGEDEEKAKAEILNNLGNLKKGLRIDNLSGYKNEFNVILDGITVILGAIAGISLIVAGLLIMTVMLTAVNERTKEIGIKKSIGASNKRIVKEFMLEAFTLSLKGGLIGAFFGAFLGLIASIIVGTGFIVNFKFIIITIGFSVFMGVLFGVYPAVKASKLNPADALRYE